MSGALTARITAGQKSLGGAPVLSGLDLDVRDGEFVALMGPTGAGKTTLLRTLLGVEQLDGGRLLVPPRRTAVFQEPGLIGSARVLDSVLPGRLHPPARRAAALQALSDVGLASLARACTATLSAEERARVALARALAREPDLLLLHEPFAHLGASERHTLQKLLAQACRRHGPAVLLVTDDVEEALLLADRIVVLKEGRVSLDMRMDTRPQEALAAAPLRGRVLAELGVPVAA